MNKNQIYCPKCRTSWLIWENVDDALDIDNANFEMSEFRTYTCHKCGKDFEVTIYFTKQIKEIKYE